MSEATTRGNSADDGRSVEAPSGWVTTKQAARSLGISPRTVRWHIDQGNIAAKPHGEGVQRTWHISIESLQAFRDARQDSKSLPGNSRSGVEGADIADVTPGNAIRDLADRLAEEAARAAEYRVRLELTEQAQSTLKEELAEERRRREDTERERDELRLRLEEPMNLSYVPDTTAEGTGKGDVAPELQEHAQRRSWWRRFFGFD
jgi:Helix-turn-helix domain